MKAICPNAGKHKACKDCFHAQEHSFSIHCEDKAIRCDAYCYAARKKLRCEPISQDTNWKRRAEYAESALKVIYTWANFNNGEAFDREQVARLCKETLEKNKL